jgi:hypothetical protein
MAIDWSGRSGPDQRRALWLAEAVDGELVRLEGGRTRAELVELLIAEATRDPNLIVGIDSHSRSRPGTSKSGSSQPVSCGRCSTMRR